MDARKRESIGNQRQPQARRGGPQYSAGGHGDSIEMPQGVVTGAVGGRQLSLSPPTFGAVNRRQVVQNKYVGEQARAARGRTLRMGLAPCAGDVYLTGGELT